MIGISIDQNRIHTAIFSNGGDFVCGQDCPAPSDSYRDCLVAIADQITQITSSQPNSGPIGVAIPGVVANGVITHSVIPHLNGKTLHSDLQAALGREIHLGNIGDCFTLFEAQKGVAAGAIDNASPVKNVGPVKNVFGMVIDASCHGRLSVNGTLLKGRNGITGNWAHLPLPAPVPYELEGQDCWCGRVGCLETFLSSSGLEDDYFKITENHQSAAQIAAAAQNNDIVAESALQVLEDRLGRATAAIINIIDPDVIVLGGMVGELDRLITNLPRKWPGYVITKKTQTELVATENTTRAVLCGAAMLPARTES
ncbi:ROK family protein [Alphaproteobacteria bacterium]|nr:ROK family protein [Alphaproteobacteria bacterium]